MSESPAPLVVEAAALIRQVQALRTGQRANQHERISALLEHARTIVNETSDRCRQSASRLNFFDALGLGNDELAHSRFLAFLLDPGAQHDQSALFLESFLKHVGLAAAASTSTLTAASVCTEFAVGGDRLDIVIFLPHFGVVCIENKIWSGEGDAQIARYQQWLASLPPGPKQVIFLTPDGRDPNTAERSVIPVRPVSYAAIAAWLHATSLAVPERLRIVLDMYADTCLQLQAQIRVELNE